MLIKTDKSDKDMVKIIFTIYVKAHDNSKKQHEAKILLIKNALLIVMLILCCIPAAAKTVDKPKRPRGDDGTTM